MLKQIISVVNSADTHIRKLSSPAPRTVAGVMTLKYSGRRAVAIGLAIAILNLSATVAFAFPKPDSKVPTAITTIGGVVTIDGLPALSGQTLFSGSSIRTAERSESTVYLDNLTRLKLYAESNLTLEFNSSSLSGSLENGSLRGFVPVGVRADILTADSSIATDPLQPATFRVQVEAGCTTVSVETGRVEIRVGSSLRSITAGERFSTGYSVSLLPGPPQHTNNRKWVWVFLGIGAAVAVLVVAITGRDHETPCYGGAVAPSGEPSPQICR
jgi:hypothetical protein